MIKGNMKNNSLLKNPLGITSKTLQIGVLSLSVFLGISFSLNSEQWLASNITCVSSPCYSGDGIDAGVDQAAGIGGISGGDPRETITKVLKTAISFVALIAVTVIVIAGMYLLFSNGNDEAKEKAKKIIFYVIAGMIVIAFAGAIVVIVSDILTD